MDFITRGFRGRPREQAPAGRLPPGQYLVRDFPVLSAGPTPHTPLSRWTFSITGEIDEPREWTWEQFRALPSETVTMDIHCVTKWSKLDTVWEGVSVDTLLAGVETAAEHAVLRALAVDDGQGWHFGRPGPADLLWDAVGESTAPRGLPVAH
jgi:DMSO/TMAO reductase YedYZ molybdopterin-dependent catalytic subunit